MPDELHSHGAGSGSVDKWPLTETGPVIRVIIINNRADKRKV